MSVWEALLFLVALKIPLVFVGFVVWRAIRAEPIPGEPDAYVPVIDTPPPGPSWTPRKAAHDRSIASPERRPSHSRPTPTRVPEIP